MKRTVSIIGLIVALALVCAGILAVAWFSVGPALVSRLPLNANLVSASADETKTVAIGETKALQVNDGAGNVTVAGGDVKQITIQVHKTSWAANASQAEKELGDIKYEVVQQGDTLIVRYQRPDQGIRLADNPDTVDFTITVPTEIEVSVETGFGKVQLSDVKGSADLQTDFGDVTVQNLQGGLAVQTQSGAVNATSIMAGAGTLDLHSGFGNLTLEKATAGNVTLDSQSGALEMTDVRASGDAELSTQFGNVSFETGSARSLSVKTDSGKIKLVSLNVSGPLKAESNFGNIDLENAKAESYEVKTSSGEITLDGVQGSIKANTGFGNITVSNAEEATVDLSTQSGSIEFEGALGEGPNSLHSDFGEIRLSLPADSALNVDLQTKFGNIKSDIPVTVVLSGETDQAHQTGTINGGGAELKVSTQSGSITIRALK